MTAATTLASFKSLKHENLRDEVLELIQAAGERGLIGDEVRSHFEGRGFKDGSINTRFSELERLGLICRNGDTRAGASGRQQLVLRCSTFGTTPTATSPAAHKRTGFLAGLMYTAKLATTSADMGELKLKLKGELIKAARKGKTT